MTRHRALRLLLLQLWQSRFQVTWWTTASVQHISEIVRILWCESEFVITQRVLKCYPSCRGRSKWRSWIQCASIHHLRHGKSATLCNILKMFDGSWYPGILPCLTCRWHTWSRQPPTEREKTQKRHWNSVVSHVPGAISHLHTWAHKACEMFPRNAQTHQIQTHISRTILKYVQHL